MIEDAFCQCGCGEVMKERKRRKIRFILGHHRRAYRGEKNKNWKGGKIISPDGYEHERIPDHPHARGNGYVASHIIIVERALGKPLPKGAHIHHWDENGRNNSNSNLLVCEGNWYHRLIHRRQAAVMNGGKANWRKCLFCKKYDDPTNMKFRANGYHGSYNHPACSLKYSRSRQRGKKGESMSKWFDDGETTEFIPPPPPPPLAGVVPEPAKETKAEGIAKKGVFAPPPPPQGPQTAGAVLPSEKKKSRGRPKNPPPPPPPMFSEPAKTAGAIPTAPFLIPPPPPASPESGRSMFEPPPPPSPQETGGKSETGSPGPEEKSLDPDDELLKISKATGVEAYKYPEKLLLRVPLGIDIIKARFLPAVQKVKQMADMVEVTKIVNDDDAKKLTALAGAMKKLIELLDDTRLEMTEPYRETTRVINTFVGEFTDVLTVSIRKAKNKILLWQEEVAAKEFKRKAAEKRIVDELQDKLRQQTEEENKQNREDAIAKGIDPAMIPPVPIPKLPQAITEKTSKKIRTESGTTAYGKEKWVGEIYDPKSVEREYCVPSQKLVDDAVEAGVRAMRGVNIYKKKDLSVRG